MKAKEIKERIFWVPAWGLSLLAVVFIGFMVMLISEIDAVYGYLTIGVLIPAACFFICWKDTGSYWYVPLICNIPGIAIMFDEGFLTTKGWLFLIVLWGLSIIAAIAGSWTGRRGGRRSKLSGE